MGSPSDGLYGNAWPSESDAPSMRLVLEAFYNRCHDISMTILSAMEMALGVPHGSFTSRCGGGASELRINHYPQLSINANPHDMHRVWPHTDLGVITCLFQDGVGGLEIEDRGVKGRFEAVEPKSPDELILNISETFERWTNGVVKAGVHIVRLPTEMRKGKKDEIVVPERFSIPFFVKADRDACVGALKEFVSEERPAKFEDMTAVEYHLQRLAKAY